MRPVRSTPAARCTHDRLPATLLRGLATGSIYALAALGFTLLWQASGTINFAQGEFVMLPAFMMLILLRSAPLLALSFALTAVSPSWCWAGASSAASSIRCFASA